MSLYEGLHESGNLGLNSDWYVQNSGLSGSFDVDFDEVDPNFENSGSSDDSIDCSNGGLSDGSSLDGSDG